MNKEYELMKINYEDSNSWTIGFIALTISSLVGVVTLKLQNLAILTFVFLVGAGIMFLRKAYLLNKIRNYLQ